ncbi:MAG: Rpn family recombination-promoting nuclease/putative transposase [Alphaproteobacteria bacterium]|nr:Rpn family recombination-promoting nuclease/putative transposase [Alphaproteobacteria bacterium]
MPIRIDPRVDFAFKKLLGDTDNADLLIDFLNSVLALPEPITAVKILNPINDRDYAEDKLSIVDVKATDASGYRFQVEIQLSVHAALAARIVYTWARVHAKQLTQGQGYDELRATFAIWLLGGSLLDSDEHHHHFQLRDARSGQQLTEHVHVHLIELPKWRAPGLPLRGEARWLYFFQNASDWDQLPEGLDDPAMRKAMDVLKDISQEEHDLARYLAREDKLRTEITIKNTQARQEARLRELEGVEAKFEQAEELLQAKSARLHDVEEQLQEKSERLEETSEQLQEKSEQLQETSEQLQETSEQLQETSEQLQETSEQLRERSDQLERLRAQLRAAGLDPEV